MQGAEWRAGGGGGRKRGCEEAARQQPGSGYSAGALRVRVSGYPLGELALPPAHRSTRWIIVVRRKFHHYDCLWCKWCPAAPIVSARTTQWAYTEYRRRRRRTCCRSVQRSRRAERPGGDGHSRRFCALPLLGARSFLRLLIPLFSINGFIAKMIT